MLKSRIFGLYGRFGLASPSSKRVNETNRVLEQKQGLGTWGFSDSKHCDQLWELSTGLEQFHINTGRTDDNTWE